MSKHLPQQAGLIVTVIHDSSLHVTTQNMSPQGGANVIQTLHTDEPRLMYLHSLEPSLNL